MGFVTRLLSLEEQLGFYAAYHQHPINKVVHVVCVPTILWTVLVGLLILTDARPLVVWSWPLGSLNGLLPLTAAFYLMLAYAAYYVLLEPFAGSLFLPVAVLLLVAAHNFVLLFPIDATQYALVAHVVSWLLQFAAHALAERRAPALFDSLVQALLLAPFFVFFEVLFLFGYRPKLQLRLKERARKDIEAWRKQSSKKAK